MGTSLEKLTTLDEKVQQAIVTLLAKGNYIKVACKAAGITYRGFRHWQSRWEGGDPDAQRFDEFFRAVDRATSIGETVALDRLQMGGPAWQAQAWFLERRFPERWGKKDRVPVEPPKPKKPIAEMTPEELDEYERQLGDGQGKDRR